MEEISQKIVDDLQPVFNGFPSEVGDIEAESCTHSLRTTPEDRTRNVFDTLYNTVAKYKKRLTLLTEEVKVLFLINQSHYTVSNGFM